MTSLVDQQILFTVPSGYALLNAADKLVIREVECVDLFATNATVGTLIVGALAIDVISEATPGHGVWVDNVRVAEDTIVAPAMTLASISPVGAAADISIGVIPKGSGGIIAAVPDNTPLGGNVRGANSIDLQLGRGAATEVASGILAIILGGGSNTASGFGSIVVGGSSNLSSGQWAFIGGGETNTASAPNSVVVGGNNNSNNGVRGFLGGGDTNQILALGTDSVVCGGSGNTANNVGSVVGGGYGNSATATMATVAGGESNTASNSYSLVAGGFGNTASGNTAAVLGGESNSATATGSTAGGGFGNVASGNYSGIFAGSGNTATAIGALCVGGVNNDTTGQYSVVVGGNFCACAATWSFIGGGDTNVITAGVSCVIGGGVNNTMQGTANAIAGGDGCSIVDPATSSFIGGGRSNRIGNGVAVSSYSTIPGGRDCIVEASYALAAGRSARALHDGAFVFADSTGVVFASTGVNQLAARFAAGYRMMGGPISLNDNGGIYSAGSVQTVGAVTGDLYTVATVNNSAIMATVQIVGVDIATGDRAVMKGAVGAKNVGGVLTVGATFDYFDDLDAGFAGASFAFVASGVSIVVQVTGPAALTADWRGVLTLSTVGW